MNIAVVNQLIYVAGVTGRFPCGEWRHFSFSTDFRLWSHGCLGQTSQKIILDWWKAIWRRIGFAKLVKLKQNLQHELLDFMIFATILWRYKNTNGLQMKSKANVTAHWNSLQAHGAGLSKTHSKLVDLHMDKLFFKPHRAAHGENFKAHGAGVWKTNSKSKKLHMVNTFEKTRAAH